MLAYLITGAFTLCYLGFTVYTCKGLKLTVKIQALCGISCALTVALSYLYIPLPTGGMLAMGSLLPIMLLSICCDHRAAIVTGAVTAILSLFAMPGWAPIHWAQPMVEHLVCFTALGYAGIFGCDKKWKMLCGLLVTLLLKTTGHVLSGILFFSDNAWEGFGAVAYSFGYNFSSAFPEAVLPAIIILLLPIPHIKKTITGERKP